MLDSMLKESPLKISEEEMLLPITKTTQPEKLKNSKLKLLSSITPEPSKPDIPQF